MALARSEGHCDSDARILVGMPFEGRSCETIGQIRQLCRAVFPLDYLVRQPCPLPGDQGCAPGRRSRVRVPTGPPLDCRRAPDNAVTGPSQDRSEESLIVVSQSTLQREEQRQVPASCGSAPACAMGGCRLRSTPWSLKLAPAADGASRLGREPAETRPATPAPAPGPLVVSKYLPRPAHCLRYCTCMLDRRLSTSAGLYCLGEDREIDRELITCLEEMPLLSGGRLALKPQ